MFENVKRLLSEQLRIEEERITLDSSISEDLGADSLDVLELLMSVESEYGISIPDEKLASFRKVRDIVDYLDSQK
ncbi:MAG: acyl carrier protein [Eubacteriales bacterium]|nr:acyl carrier protein [Eubacteriales bacterium]